MLDDEQIYMTYVYPACFSAFDEFEKDLPYDQAKSLTVTYDLNIDSLDMIVFVMKLKEVLVDANDLSEEEKERFDTEWKLEISSHLKIEQIVEKCKYFLETLSRKG